MKFKDEYHETLFWVIMQKMNRNDVYHQSVAYLIALDDVCRDHVEEIYDFEEQCINLECLDKAWQTGTSLKTTRLAFNLWNGYCIDPETDLPSGDYSVSEIFCCSYAPYYWEAVKIRYPEYIDE